MTSYFEKLTSINTSSLNIVSGKFQGAQGVPSDLSSALEKIEELKEVNNKLELDLKCECDEKSDLVSLKVGLESEILELREVNERLQFQVDNLKEEKDKIHHVLAKMKEDLDEKKFMFIASSGGASGGIMKKFPSLDDLSLPSTSPTDSTRANACLTPTSTTSCGHLERIDEQDELESLVVTGESKPHSNHTLEQLMKRIAFLDSENEMLRTGCTRCRKARPSNPNPSGVIFEHEDEGLVLSAVDEDDEEDRKPTESSDEHQLQILQEIQRKIIDKLEMELFRTGQVTDLRDEMERMKSELEVSLGRIVRRSLGGERGGQGGGAN